MHPFCEFPSDPRDSDLLKRVKLGLNEHILKTWWEKYRVRYAPQGYWHEISDEKLEETLEWIQAVKRNPLLDIEIVLAQEPPF